MENNEIQQARNTLAILHEKLKLYISKELEEMGNTQNIGLTTNWTLIDMPAEGKNNYIGSSATTFGPSTYRYWNKIEA